MNLLIADRITAGYSQLPVIRDVTVRARPATIVSIVGPNGSGKSTLLKAIIGLLKPMTGHVTLGDREVTGLAPYRIARQGIGYVPQLSSVFDSLTVVENLEMGAFARSGHIKPQIEKVLSAFPDLLAARRKKATELSGGQRNLLGLARALMVDPQVILVDEPSAGLSPINSKRIWEQLVAIAASGAGVIVVEQNVDLALQNSEWCYVMVAGRNRLDGPSTEVRKRDLNAIFLGQSEDGSSSVDHEGERPSAPVGND